MTCVDTDDEDIFESLYDRVLAEGRLPEVTDGVEVQYSTSQADRIS